MNHETETYLRQCKDQALKVWATGDLATAVVTMVGALEAHPETQPNASLIAVGLLFAANNDVVAVRDWIEGWR